MVASGGAGPRIPTRSIFVHLAPSLRWRSHGHRGLVPAPAHPPSPHHSKLSALPSLGWI